MLTIFVIPILKLKHSYSHESHHIKTLPEIDAAFKVDELCTIVKENTINCSKRYEKFEKCEKDLVCLKFRRFVFKLFDVL